MTENIAGIDIPDTDLVKQATELVRASADPVLYDRGDYATYVPRWTSRLPADRLLILPFGLIAKDPAGIMRRVEAFCGLTPHAYRGLNAKVFAANAELSVPPEARAKIRERLEPQFAFLEATFDAEFNRLIR